jgi:hypothetical protein
VNLDNRAQDMERWPAILNVVMILRLPYTAGNLFAK